ncbi:unnamed protein product [Aspergillus oryzae]|nr:unnamed protein product [Aspergillus oryzae]GMF85347.1 unnamed protein product [Aspergillus oryzae]
MNLAAILLAKRRVEKMRGTSVAESTSGRPLWGAMPHWRLLSRVVTARQLDSKRGCDMSVNPYGGSVSEGGGQAEWDQVHSLQNARGGEPLSNMESRTKSQLESFDAEVHPACAMILTKITLSDPPTRSQEPKMAR